MKTRLLHNIYFDFQFPAVRKKKKKKLQNYFIFPPKWNPELNQFVCCRISFQFLEPLNPRKLVCTHLYLYISEIYFPINILKYYAFKNIKAYFFLFVCLMTLNQMEICVVAKYDVITVCQEMRGWYQMLSISLQSRGKCAFLKCCHLLLLSLQEER